MKKHSDTAPDGKNARLAEKYIKRGESEKYCKLLGDVLEGLDIKRRAVERTASPLSFPNSSRWSCPLSNTAKFPRSPVLSAPTGKRGAPVSSNYCVTHLYFGSDRIFLYSYLFSVIGRYAREEVAEVCYRDIVCARAVRETRPVGESAEGKGAVVAATAKLFIGLASGELCIPWRRGRRRTQPRRTTFERAEINMPAPSDPSFRSE